MTVAYIVSDLLALTLKFTGKSLPSCLQAFTLFLSFSLIPFLPLSFLPKCDLRTVLLSYISDIQTSQFLTQNCNRNLSVKHRFRAYYVSISLQNAHSITKSLLLYYIKHDVITVFTSSPVSLLVVASTEIGLEVNADKTMYCTWSCLEIRRQEEVTI